MLDKESKVQGVGVYAEFTRDVHTIQLLITPDMYNSAGRVIPLTIHTRQVNLRTPKKQWTMNKLNSNLATSKYMDSDGAVVAQIATTDVAEYVRSRFIYQVAVFNKLLVGWTIRKAPILVEVTKFDADDIWGNKTPNKILYRIKVSRKALGFPDELIIAGGAI